MKVTVIGAGVVGCAVAYELVSRGALVHVLDARATGQGATRAAAGMLVPYIEGHHSALLELGVCSLHRYDELIARLRNDVPNDLEYGRAGSIQVAFEKADVAALSALAVTLSARGVEHAWLDAGEARQLEPALSDTVLGALRIPGHGHVAASALTATLAVAAAARGVSFLSDRVTDVVPTALDVRVATSSGQTITSDVVVIAAGSWSTMLATITPAAAASAVRPIRGQLVHLRHTHRVAASVVWGAGCYLVPWRDGSVLVGATVEDVGFEETTTAGGVKRLLDAALRLMPSLSTAALDDVRVGLRPATSDEMPIIGRSSLSPRVCYATGHYRNGVLLAPLTATLVADLMLHDREHPQLALTRPDRVGL